MRKIIIDLLMKIGSSVWSDFVVFETLFVSQIVSAAQQREDPDGFIHSMLLKYNISNLPFSLDDDGVKKILLRIASYVEKMPPADLYRVICPFAVFNEGIDTAQVRRSSFYYAVCQAIRFLDDGEPSGLAVMVRDAVNNLPFPGSDESTDIIAGTIESIENITISQNIPTGRNVYEDEFYNAASKMNLSPYQAMELYGIFLSDEDDYISTPKPWMLACGRHHYLSQMYSGSDMDELFDRIVCTSESDPFEMVRSFLYSPESDESGFHTSYMVALVCSVIKPEHNLLLIDPSPEVLHVFNSEKVHCDCVVSHVELLPVYKQIFPNIGLFEKDHIPFMDGRYDIIVDISGWLAKGTGVDDAFSFRMLCSENCLIISEINNSVFEKNKTELLRLLYRDNQLLLSFILRLPDLFPERKGRKKATSLFVFNTSTFNQEFHNIEIYTMKFNSANSARILHEHPYVKYSEFLSSKQTIIKMAGTALDTLRGKEKGETRSLPKNHFITPDVAVQIGIFNPKNGKYPYIPGSLNYKKIDGTNLLSSSKRLTGKNLPTLLKNMEDLAYNDLYNDISDDVYCRIRKRTIMSPSLMTIWFVLRNPLKEKARYNEELCRDIFSDNHPSISRILPYSAMESDYSFAFIDDYRLDGTYQIPLKVLRQIDLILSVAEKKRLPVQRKPIQELKKKVSNAMTDEQIEVRDAFMKRAYDDDEEERLIRYIFEHADDASSTGFVLYMILRLYLPATVNEIRALTLRDYIKAKRRNDLHAVSISKYKDGNDTITKYLGRPKDRDLPIPICFTDVFMACVQRLHGEDDVHNPDNPLIPSPDGMFCFLTYAEAHEFDERIDSIAGTDEKHFSIFLPDQGKERMTDLYVFFGDIHYTHWKYIAKEAGLEENEINYILGIKPSNTFAAHYADYGCPLSLKRMARKINRWITGFLSCDMTVRKGTGTIPLKTTIGLSQRRARFCGEIKEAEGCQIIQADNCFGWEATITVY